MDSEELALSAGKAVKIQCIRTDGDATIVCLLHPRRPNGDELQHSAQLRDLRSTADNCSVTVRVHEGGGLVARTPGVLTMHATSRPTGVRFDQR